MRWGIKALCPDMKTRGFKDCDKIERLILILSVVNDWAVSTGMRPKPPRLKKKRKEVSSPHSNKD
jgi:hypothetical protein